MIKVALLETASNRKRDNFNLFKIDEKTKSIKNYVPLSNQISHADITSELLVRYSNNCVIDIYDVSGNNSLKKIE